MDPTDLSKCGATFVDNCYKCQCVFAAERLTGGGLQLDAFDPRFRCPANAGCILANPVIRCTEYFPTLSGDYIDGSQHDADCALDRCFMTSIGGECTVDGRLQAPATATPVQRFVQEPKERWSRTARTTETATR